VVLDPQLRIVAVSDAYLRATMTQRTAIVGRPLFEVFPDNPDDPASDGVAKLTASLERVATNHRADTMAVQHYDIRRPPEQGGGFDVRYWSPANSPVLDASGQLVYIIHQVEDVTDRILAEEKLETARVSHEIFAERERIASELHDLVLLRLSANTMTLAGAVKLAVDPEVADRIVKVIDDLDATIGSIRSTIFESGEADRSAGGGSTSPQGAERD